VTSASPTVRRRELGARLRALRLAAGMTVEDVAARMEVSPAKISRIETGARGVSLADVRFLCDLYEVSLEDRDDLLTLTRESRRRSWWQQYGIPASVKTYTGLEDAAVSIYQYETSLVPGLLQTEAYAAAVTAEMLMDAEPGEAEQVVRARLIRQGRLAEAEPPELWAVLDEAALLRVVGEPGVMREQLEQLADRSRANNVTVQVIPFDAGPHPAMSSSFVVLHLEEVSDVVYVEGLLGHFFLQSPPDLLRYRRAFDRLRAIALGPRASEDLIRVTASRLPT
jgi:transcriptional regulator with XRE-family HTH domain